MRVLLAASLLLVSCVGATHIDYVDFVKANGISYVGADYFGGGRVGRALVEADLGAEQFRIKHMLSGEAKGPDYRTLDGDSAFVPAGAPVYAVNGYATTFRLAAHRDGRLVLYEADSNPAAKIGRDLLDIEGKVTSIVLLSDRDGHTILGRITDPRRVADLVRQVLAAPVDQSPPAARGTPAPATAAPQASGTPPISGSPSAVVGFELADGTGTSRGYDMVGNVLHRGIQVGGSFRSAIEELVAAAPTPTPVPAAVNLVTKYDLAKATRVTMKQVRSGAVQDATRVSRIVAALDAELPAVRLGPMESEAAALIFEFPDHFVTLTYDAGSGLLRVTIPNDEFGVRPGTELRQLLEETR